MNTEENNPEVKAIKICLFERSGDLYAYDFGNFKNMKRNIKLMFKILIICIIPREGSTYQTSWDHKHFIFYLVKEDKINLLAYIFHNLYEAIRDITKHLKKKFVIC